MLRFHEAQFVLSVHKLKQLPPPDYAEFAFAGRSNVGKSSLLNKLLGRKSYVKVSGRPGKTQGLNFFLVDDSFYLVDLPGYGFAKVSKSLQEGWQELIANYLRTRANLCCVVVIMDIRHPPKNQDSQLLDWLRQEKIRFLPVYTKADKLSGNQRTQNAALLDAGHNLSKNDRIIFSAKTGMGLDDLKTSLSSCVNEE